MRGFTSGKLVEIYCLRFRDAKRSVVCSASRNDEEGPEKGELGVLTVRGMA